MEWTNAFRVGMKGLAVHKVRAGLSMLGIIFGVSSVVAVIAVSEGARGEMLKQLAALGANNISVKEGLDWRDTGTESREKKKTARLVSDGLTVREADAAAASCPLFSAYAPLCRTSARVRHGERPVSGEVVGTTPAFLQVMNFRIREGRWLNAADEQEQRRVCVIEDALRLEVFPLVPPVGQTLILDHEPYTVVGVMESKEETEEAKGPGERVKVVDIRQLNRRLYIPLSTALSRTTRPALADELDEVIFQCRDAGDIRLAADLLGRFYESAHRAEGVPEEKRDYQVVVAKELLEKLEQAQNIFNIVMLCSAGISLLVGGIGIMNIMLANVSERRREVGIRRAVGATQLDVLKQFLLESLIICLVGGVAGCLLGVGFTGLVHYLTGWQTVLPLWGMFAAVAVSLADGVAFGTYPAWQAAQLDPIEALQYE